MVWNLSNKEKRSIKMIPLSNFYTCNRREVFESIEVLEMYFLSRVKSILMGLMHA